MWPQGSGSKSRKCHTLSHNSTLFYTFVKIAPHCRHHCAWSPDLFHTLLHSQGGWSTLYTVVLREPRAVKYNMINSMIRIAHIHVKDRNYDVYVGMSTVTRNLHVFKYNEQDYRCEYEVFSDHNEAQDYLELLL